MRSIRIVLFAAFLAATTCYGACTAPSTVVFPATSTCASYVSCGGNLCSCLGVSGGDPQACYASSSSSCAAKGNCLATYMSCLNNVSSLRNETSGTCASPAQAIHAAVLSATAGYSGSSLQANCAYRLCEVTNSSTTCSFGTGFSSLCTPPAGTIPVATASTTAAPPTTMPPSTPNRYVAAVVGVLTISGTAWPFILNGSAARMQIVSGAVSTDIANLLVVNVIYINIFSMTAATSNSMVVRFGVAAGAHVQPSVLVPRVIAGSGTSNWLSATRAAYSSVAPDTIFVSSFTVESTAAPGVVTNSSNFESSSFAVPMWTAVAMASMVAVFA